MNNNNENAVLGKKLITAAVNLDEALAELLKVEIRRLKQLSKCDTHLEEFQKTINIVRSVVMALTLTEDKIKTGVSLCRDNKD